MSETINGYTLLEPLQNKNAGFSRWTFAQKEDEVFFIKEFMDPIYPTDSNLSETIKKQRISGCQKYESHKKKLYHAVNRASDGNLIEIVEFFRMGSHYYTVTPKVKTAPISMERLKNGPLPDRLLLCLTAAHALMKLHEEHIVHADIKEANVLLTLSPMGKPVAKIIDFDCAFFESEAPESEDDLGGDQVFLSPEACLFLIGEEDSSKLTCKMDVFAMGLLFHKYLTGELPGYDSSEYDYAHESVLDGQELTISPKLPEAVRDMLRQMLVADPEERVSMKDVFHVLHEMVYPKPVRKDEPKKNVLSSADIAKLPMRERLIICQKIAKTLAALHHSARVFGAVSDKMIPVTEGKDRTLEVSIEPCSYSFFVSERPENVYNNVEWWSPELYRFKSKNGDFRNLSYKMDVFCTSLLFHKYLTGKMPMIQHETCRVVGVAVDNGYPIQIDRSIPEELNALLRLMLSKQPDMRPSMDEVDAAISVVLFKMDNSSGDMPGRVMSDNGGKLVMGGDFFKKAGDI